MIAEISLTKNRAIGGSLQGAANLTFCNGDLDHGK